MLNDSSVLRARLFGRKVGSGGKVEVLLLRSWGAGKWSALVRGRCPEGTFIAFHWKGIVAQVAARDAQGEATLIFDPPGGAEILMAERGFAPLPPYLKRGEESARELRRFDLRRYQTVYAAVPGSIAAPTAARRSVCFICSPETPWRTTTSNLSKTSSGISVCPMLVTCMPGSIQSAL